MRGWIIREFNSPPELCSLPQPVPATGKALVRITHCALNFADLLMLAGKYQEMPPLPFSPGLEFSGIVAALGPETRGPAIGSRVACYSGHGGLAEYGCVDADALIEIPDEMAMDIAAAFPIAYGTSHLALTHKARLQPGETLFVTGAGGGVGLTAVELGRQLGARVIATARGKDKLDAARKAGADVTIDSEVPDMKDQLRALGGIDVTYDAVGGALFDAALRASRPDGRILCIGFAGGSVPQIPANHLLVKNVSAIGFWWGGYFKSNPSLPLQSLRDLMKMFRDGKLKPLVSASYRLEDVPEALKLLKDRKATGKIVIKLR